MSSPPLTPEKTYFFEKYQFLVRFSVISKSRFFRGLRGSHGFHHTRSTIYSTIALWLTKGFQYSGQDKSTI